MKGPANVFALLLSLGMSVAAHAEYVIKFSHAQASGTVKGQAADYFAEQVNKRLAGKVRVEVYPDSKLHDDAEVLEAVRQANGDTGIMAAPPIDRIAERAGALGIFELPFLFDRIESVHRLVDSPLGETLLEPLEGDGLKGLTIWDEGMKVFSVRGARPLRKPPEDFKGKKLGTWGSEIDKATIEALGATAQELPAAQAFGALSEGKLDGQESLLTQTYGAKLYEVQDWISVSEHVFQGFLLVIGTRFWNALPEDIRDELAAVVDESTLQARKIAAKSAAEDRKRIEESGNAIVLGLTSDEREVWRDATAGVEERFAARIGEDLVGEVHALLAQPEPPVLEDAETLEASGSDEPAPSSEDESRDAQAPGVPTDLSEAEQAGESPAESQSSEESGPVEGLESPRASRESKP